MKKIIIYLISATFLLSFNASFAQGNRDLAKRYLKLANSYRQVGEFSMGEKFAEKAKAIVSKDKSFEGEYWTAVANESLAYLYCDQGNTEMAKSAILSALEIYGRRIKQKDGSQHATAIFLKQISDFGCPCVSSNFVSTEDPSGDEFTEGDDAQGIDDGEEISEDVEIEKDIKGETVIQKKIVKKVRSVPGMRMPSSGISRDYTGALKGNIPGDIPSNIQNLSFANDKLQAFPEISPYKNLQYLDLSDNKISEIPQSATNAKNLKVLSLRNNKLKNVDALTKMKNLRVIDLRGNKMEFSKIKRLLQSMPNALIYHDEYIPKPEEDEDEE